MSLSTLLSRLMNILTQRKLKNQSPILQQKEVKQPQIAPVNHEHKFTLLLKTFAPPVRDLPNPIDPTMERAIFGVTTLLWECPCSITKKEEVLGSDEDQLEDLFNKATLYGPQYIQRDTNTFVIAKYLVPPQQGTTVPIR